VHQVASSRVERRGTPVAFRDNIGPLSPAPKPNRVRHVSAQHSGALRIETDTDTALPSPDILPCSNCHARNTPCPVPPPPRIALYDVARVRSANVIHTHACCKPVVPTTVVVAPAVVAVTPAVILSGDRGDGSQEAQRCRSDKACLHDRFSSVLKIKRISWCGVPKVAGAA
jgi:hypothetical protein